MLCFDWSFRFNTLHDSALRVATFMICLVRESFSGLASHSSVTSSSLSSFKCSFFVTQSLSWGNFRKPWLIILPWWVVSLAFCCTFSSQTTKIVETFSLSLSHSLVYIAKLSILLFVFSTLNEIYVFVIELKEFSRNFSLKYSKLSCVLFCRWPWNYKTWIIKQSYLTVFNLQPRYVSMFCQPFKRNLFFPCTKDTRIP